MKSKETINRLKKRGITAAANATKAPAVPQPQFSPKDVEAILIDVCLRELYNNGDRRDLNFVKEILTPNKITVPAGKPLESFWDIITSTGLMKAVIGFGRQGWLTLTGEGYNLMNQYGSYINFLNKTMPPGCPPEKEEKKVEQPVVHPNATPPVDEPMDGVQ
ncbi:hypothetical protein DBR32_12230 [Taibaiella sp. KBW10]|uniref:hypothetical protein n=1 Tax=Taibaiella sp. KBW10 TaxID=2153357 RepID=UPI000F5AF13F|nr:hypothetical protein [Taibaiella sp. KBW10]RQO30332.1 hypothetical protein DBR32_12230 [Taibaiella sp. KBW10]